MGPHETYNFYKARDTLNRNIESTKQQHTAWEMVFINTLSVRGLISKIYTELKKLDSNKPNNPILKNELQS